MNRVSDLKQNRRVPVSAAAAPLAAVVLLFLLPHVSQAASRRECGRISLPHGYTALVNVEGASCRSARVAVRDNLAKRIRFQTGGTGITRKRGWRCTPAHGDEAVCNKRNATAFGYDLSR